MTRHVHYAPPSATVTMPSLFDDTPAPAHRADHGDETERLAAEKVRPALGWLRSTALNDLRNAPDGLTGDELCALHPEVPEYSLRPRLTELADLRFGALAVKTGATRPNRRGNAERVWRAA